MKKYYKNALLSLFIGLNILSCNQNSRNQSLDNPDSLMVETKHTLFTKTSELHVKPDFDVEKFVTLTDSLLTNIQQKAINLNFKIENITSDSVMKSGFFNPLFISENAKIKRYSFDPGKDNRALRIWLVEAIYHDSISTDNVFNELQKQSGKVDGEEDFLPGLTYTNDFVIKSSNKIYWLKSGCSYAFYNHKKLTEFMLQSLRVDTIQDSIWCKCGQPKCSL
jgi:hypothetical protein